MSNDYWINTKTWVQLRDKRYKEQNKEYYQELKKKDREENREYYLAYHRARSERERQRLAQGKHKFNFNTKGDMFRFKGSKFEMKETPNDTKLPVGLENKIYRVRKNKNAK